MKNRRKAGEYGNKIQTQPQNHMGSQRTAWKKLLLLYVLSEFFFVFWGEALDPNCAPEWPQSESVQYFISVVCSTVCVFQNSSVLQMQDYQPTAGEDKTQAEQHRWIIQNDVLCVCSNRRCHISTCIYTHPCWHCWGSAQRCIKSIF